MGNVLGSWSGMRKYLEKEMLADTLKGRVRYSCTTYPGMDGCYIFAVFIDNKPVKHFSFDTIYSYLGQAGYKKEERTWSKMWDYIEQNPIHLRTEYIDNEFADALCEYRNQDIKISIQSNNPLVRMFAVLDRRIGKRTLYKLKNEIEEQPRWLQQFYMLRISAEL
jgi:hypothetical protein